MTLATLFTVFETIGSIAGILITLITFFTLITKKPKQLFRKMLREECDAANENLKEQMEKINEHLKGTDEVDLAVLRNTITHIYFKYKDEKRIPHYEKENVMSLYEQYKRLKGNTYVRNVIHEIQQWDETL